jgi:hypothetical protein
VLSEKLIMSTEDDEAFARMLQHQLMEEERILMEQEQQRAAEQDAEYARQLQRELERQERNAPGARAVAGNRRQEEEDERLARMLAESGGSLRDLDLTQGQDHAEGETQQLATTIEYSNSNSSSQAFQDAPRPVQVAVRNISYESTGSAADSVRSRQIRRSPQSSSEFPDSPEQPMLSSVQQPTHARGTSNAGSGNPDEILASTGVILDTTELSNEVKPKGFMKTLFRGRSGGNRERHRSPKNARDGRSRGNTPTNTSDLSLTSPTVAPASAASYSNDPDVRYPIPEPELRPLDTIGAPRGPIPYSFSVSRPAPEPPETTVGRRPAALPFPRAMAMCAACNRPVQKPVNALDQKYHNDCFRCVACHTIIDPTQPFAFIENHNEKQPMHRGCYAEIFGIKCSVCSKSIPAGPDGNVSFVKHPFFDTEQMCPHHAQSTTRRCTGCHRFEPEHAPFADLNDVGRCVCMACCRSVIVDSQDAQPLWDKVVQFFENKLNLPIWKSFREVPILIVGYEALNDQMTTNNNAHRGATQIMTRGICLSEHECGRRFKMNRMKFLSDSNEFIPVDAEERGFTFFQVPDPSKVNPGTSVTAILCLSGLPRDLAASVLAHEATHAWIKLHPRFDIEKPIPTQVEEGVAQLIALLFLNEGLDKGTPPDSSDLSGPSDEKLRQYFKFSIETEEHDIYGTGYRRAAKAYSHIGIEALMSHIILYQDFPET